MKTRTITAFVVFTMMVCLASGAFAAAPKLIVGSASIDSGESGTVNITVDNATGITGAAFTLTYDTSILDITVTSDFFGTFEEQGFDVADGLGTDGKVDGYDSPVVTNEVSTGMMIAAANATAATSGTNVALFTLNIAVSDTAIKGSTYDINITATTLNNTAAGYDAAGEQIDLLIEAKADGTFASLLTAANAAANVTKGVITVEPGGKMGDLTGDGKVTTPDVLLAIQMLEQQVAGDAQKKLADMNGDGKITTPDILLIIQALE